MTDRKEQYIIGAYFNNERKNVNKKRTFRLHCYLFKRGYKTQMSSKTYVYEGKEVVLTGRTAEKTLRSERKKVLHEIRPSDVDADNRMHNKWVELTDLFEIIE